jgi:hypothetical protein
MAHQLALTYAQLNICIKKKFVKVGNNKLILNEDEVFRK